LTTRLINFVKNTMEVFNTPNKIIITCNKRLATYLQQEVVDLGFDITRSFSTGVELFNTLNDTIHILG